MSLENGISIEENSVPVLEPEGVISVRVYTPHSDSPDETFPLLVVLHGGHFFFTLFSYICTNYPFSLLLLPKNLILTG